MVLLDLGETLLQTAYLVAIAIGLLLTYWLVRAAQRGRWLQASMAVLLASVVTGTVIGWAAECRSPLEQLDPAVVSWAYLGGDGFWLPITAAAAAFAWRVMPPGVRRYFTHWWWYVFSVVVGGAMAVAFHISEFVNTTYRYVFAMPTKIFHNATTYPTLAIALWCICWPVLISACLPGEYWRRRIALAVVVLFGIGVWFWLGVQDANRDLLLHVLHPQAWQWSPVGRTC